MFTLLLIIHIIVCLLIIFFVLLQAGRGAELGAAFGSVGQANSVRGKMTGVGKMTAVVAVIFMLTSLGIDNHRFGVLDSCWLMLAGFGNINVGTVIVSFLFLLGSARVGGVRHRP